jgi:uncharacterized protein (DUF924 family)
MTHAADVLDFWLSAGPEKWYVQDDAFDQEIRDNFGQTWRAANGSHLPDWASDADGALALIILLDQFPRNMFREDPRAFVTDEKALEISGKALAHGWDRDTAEPQRQFFYMPFMHSENLDHQDTCVELMDSRMETGNNALHARAHREIIRRFGRFPYRNNALGRDTTPEEQAFMDQGGYRAMFQEVQGNHSG